MGGIAFAYGPRVVIRYINYWEAKLLDQGLTLETSVLKSLYALVSGKPRTPIPRECRALVGDFSGFRLSLLPRYARSSTTLDASFGKRGPLAGLTRGFTFDIILNRHAKNTGRAYGLKMAAEGKHGNNGVNMPARLSHACFSLNKSFALKGISFIEHPFLYEMSGAPCKFSFNPGFLLIKCHL